MKIIQDRAGFTLIEVLIVVILLGIISAIIVPQVNISTDDAKLNTLKTNLKCLRKAAGFYYYQHDNTYPGAKNTGGNPSTSAAVAVIAFERQLTRYTAVGGKVSNTRDATYGLGPYINGTALPANPYNGKNDVKCDIITTDINARDSDGTTGWKFYVITGVLLANDGAHDNL